MRPIYSGIITAGLIIFAQNQARAAVLFDTGPATFSRQYGQTTLGQTQFIAGRITVEDAYILTGIEAFLATSPRPGVTPGTFSIILYGDGGLIPDTSSLLFSSRFEITSGPPEGDWYGDRALNWNILPGSYWIALEGRPGDTYLGSLPDPVPNPLEAYAYYFHLNPGYMSLSGSPQFNTFGYRVFGEASSQSVPEPTSLLAALLFGLGLAGASIRKW